ncbi:MAG: SPOR domain-containing protein [Rhodobiaceae bacterium]|nr:SPOR domain-containing protein [Rhodobiaceae bacterium]MCC0057058.1 SPOR domain-containing protein [Rhodobiaceae bacterium]
MAETYDRRPNQRADEDWEPKNDPNRFDSDPLAELARLVDEDPFADMARPREAAARPVAPEKPVERAAASPAPARPAAAAPREPSPYDTIASKPQASGLASSPAQSTYRPASPAPARPSVAPGRTDDRDLAGYTVRKPESALGEGQMKPSDVQARHQHTEMPPAPAKSVMPPQRRLTAARDTSFGFTPQKTEQLRHTPSVAPVSTPRPAQTEAPELKETKPPMPEARPHVAPPAARPASPVPDADHLFADIGSVHEQSTRPEDDFDFDEAFGQNDEGFVWYDEPPTEGRTAEGQGNEPTAASEPEVEAAESSSDEGYAASEYDFAAFEAELTKSDPYDVLGSVPPRAKPSAPPIEPKAPAPTFEPRVPLQRTEMKAPETFEPDAFELEDFELDDFDDGIEAEAPVPPTVSKAAPPLPDRKPPVVSSAAPAVPATPAMPAYTPPRSDSALRYADADRSPPARDPRDEAHFDSMIEQELDFSEFDPSFDDSGHMPPLSDEEVADFGTHAGTEGSGRRRGLVMFGALVALIVAGGAGVLAYNSIFSEIGGGEPPTLAAQDGPVKTKPAEPGGAEIPNQNKLVYDRLGGNEQPAEERVVSREEQVDQPSGDSGVRVIGTNVVPRGEDSGRLTREEVPSAQDAAPRPTSEATPLTPAPAPDQPKRVKTVVVKPDGTVVGQPQAPVTPAPVAPPSAPLRIANAPAAPSREGDAPAVQREAPAPAPTQPVNNVPAGRPLSLTPSAINNAPSTPAPAPAPTRVATAQPAPSPAPVATSSGPAGTYVVQVASRKSEDQAQSAVSAIKSRYNAALGGYVPNVERADLGDKGVFYRVGVGPISSQQEAVSLCERLKSAGQDCFVRRN